MNIAESKEYKSPPGKLLAVFRLGRDQWKEKCAEGKRQIKYLKTRIKRLESSKTELEDKIKDLQEEVCVLNAQFQREHYERSRLEFEEEEKKLQSQSIIR